MTRATKNTDDRIGRIDAIFDKLEQELNRDPDSASFSFDYLGTDWGDPSLNDILVLKQTLNRVQDVTDGEVTWETTSKTLEPEGTYSAKEKHVLDKIVITMERPSAIKEYRQKLKKNILPENKGVKKTNKIEIIEIYEPPEGDNLEVYVNKNYENEDIKPKKKKYWGAVLEIAREGYARTSDAGKIADYFNTNKSNPLYKYSGCNLTEVLVADDGDLRPKIKIDTITQKALSQRKNKSLKTT